MRRWPYPTRWRRTRRGLSDGNCIDTPALAGAAAVASRPPAKYKVGASRETHRGRDKSARVAGPCLPASERIAAASTDRAIVTAGNKGAACGNNVLKGQPVIKADFKHAAVKALLKIEVILKCYRRRIGGLAQKDA